MVTIRRVDSRWFDQVSEQNPGICPSIYLSIYPSKCPATFAFVGQVPVRPHKVSPQRETTTSRVTIPFTFRTFLVRCSRHRSRETTFRPLAGKKRTTVVVVNTASNRLSSSPPFDGRFRSPKFCSPLRSLARRRMPARTASFDSDGTEITANRIADRMSRPTEASLSAGRAASQIAERVAHACARYSSPSPAPHPPFLPPLRPLLATCLLLSCAHAATRTFHPSMRVYTSSQNSISSSRSRFSSRPFSPPTTSPTCSLSSH